MGFDFAFFAALAIGLGVKHAFDADHLVAVSGLLTRAQRLGTALGLAGSWAAGHLVTAALVSALVYYFAGTMLPGLLSRLELMVPLMLLLIGMVGLGVEFRRFHIHRHTHDTNGPAHRHLHLHVGLGHRHGAMAGIGVVHGLASNDELLVVLLVGLGASAWWQVLAGVGLFSFGVLMGMLVYAIGLDSLNRRVGVPWMASFLNVAFSVLSVGYAVYLLLGGAGLNLAEGWIGEG